MFSTHPRFRKPSAAMEAEIDSIISRMTLEEKAAMIGGAKDGTGEAGNTISCKRVGIPSFRMADASSGVHWWIEDTTTFPASIALAASFNTWLAGQYAAAIARDCLAGGIHILLGPGVNIYRSPLCGRNFEYFGEDPCLAAQMAVAYIRGLQAHGVAATLKHYAVNNQEFDRNHVSSDLDERTLREVYLAAFEAGVKEAGAGAVMTGYNLVNGLHCSEHPWLIRDILKGDWGFDGIVMSDWVSVHSDIGSATAGLDLEMPFAVWLTPEKLVPAVREGRLSEKVIDDKIRRLLRLALCFGWIGREQKFEEPGRNPRNAQVALEVARESMVLLKNDGLLPLDFGTIGNLAVIGPTSHPAVIGGGGSCFNKGWRTVSFLDGIKALAPAGLVVNHAKGFDAAIADESYARSVFLAPDGQPGVLAEFFNSNDLSGPAVLSRRDERINHIWKDKEIAPGVNKKDFSIRFRSAFDTIRDGSVDFYLHIWDGAARLSIDGVKVFDTWDREVFGDHCVAAELKAGRHELVLEFRNIRTWNSICLGWDCECRKAQEYRKALDLARKASAVVFCGGFDQRSEGEGADRGFSLPTESEGLLRDVLELNSRVVVVLTGGGNVDMAAWHDRCAAIIHAWFPGQEGGTALAEIISGAVNPSGRLPATFERRLEDRSSFDCYHDSDGDRRVSLNDGVFGGHRHFDRSGTAPRYPFGYGLSYTSFAYDRLSLSSQDVDFRDQTAMVTIHFDLTNTGLAAGAEVSQLYLSPPVGRIARPPKELKGFAKCHLEPGQRMRVALSLKARDFAWYDVDASGWRIEPGTYTVSIAASATDIRLTASVLVPAECLLSV